MGFRFSEFLVSLGFRLEGRGSVSGVGCDGSGRVWGFTVSG